MDVRERSRVSSFGALLCLVNLLLPADGSASDSGAASSLAQAQRQIQELQAEYAARYAALQHETEAKLSAIEAQIAVLKAQEDTARRASEAIAPAQPGPTSQHDPPLDIRGDFRLRYEHTIRHAGVPARDRGVLRGRLGAAYAVNDRFTVGSRLTTGDPNDPNSADSTMGEFVDDLTVSLDQAYARYRLNNWEIVGGKFANPFARTDLVWDGDVNPHGLAGRYTLYQDTRKAVRVTGIYSIVDEQIAADDSDMLGAQVSLDFSPAADWQFGIHAAYYDYEIGSLLAADFGDTRDNNLSPDGSAYLSDFNLLDFVVRMDYLGLPGGWPLHIGGDYVHNQGAAVSEDSGWSMDLSLGELTDVGDWRFGYGYAVAEADAVLGAFSQDNTTYATNYREQAVTIDYLALDHTLLNLTGYVYRREDFSRANQPGDSAWISRVRLNLQFSF